MALQYAAEGAVTSLPALVDLPEEMAPTKAGSTTSPD
jgi:hypothetical protein